VTDTATLQPPHNSSKATGHDRPKRAVTITEMRTSRNPDGQRSEVRYYDSSLKLVKQGRAIERFIYDAEGNLSETMRLDSAGMLIKP
jgi:hypothetical protein